MPHPLDGGPAFRLCVEAIEDEVRRQATAADMARPFIAQVGLIGAPNTVLAYEKLLKKWWHIQWAGWYLRGQVPDEDIHRAIMLRPRP